MNGRLNPRASLLAALMWAANPAFAGAAEPSPVQADPAAPAPAASAPLGPLPPGWTIALTDVIAAFSAPTGEGSITIVAPPVIAADGDLRAAIVERAPALIEDLFGEPRPAGEPTPLPASDSVAPGLLIPLLVSLDDGSEARIEATGYPLPGKRLQLFIAAFPAAMSDANPQLELARTLIDQWRAAGLAITDQLTAQTAGRPASTPGEDDADAAPSAGTAPAQIEPNPDETVENVIYFLRFAFNGTAPAKAGEPVATTALLLKDGRVFEGETRAPADFDPASRPPGSPGTGRWQRDGEAYALAFSDGTQGTAVAAAAKTFPAPAALSFAGTYRAIGGVTSDLLSDQIDFYPDGSLLLKDADSVRSGHYAISERTIVMGLKDGTPVRYVFGYQGDTDAPELLVIGGRVYERATP